MGAINYHLCSQIWKISYSGSSEKFIPKPVWAIGFAPEQPLHVVALTCSASEILK
ncbi:MAG: hypothetical protein LBJ00_08620 [Planctomycetaceae bacterium]|nr:hypothetical protein [Planctomycetaceae bacterium]